MWFDAETQLDGQNGPDFDLVCPSCGGRCIGKTYVRGVRGTYRNPYVGYCVRRILCTHCGVVGDLKSGVTLDYQLWYRIIIDDNILWAENEHRLRQIRDLLAGDENRNHSALYALPKWLIKGTSRSKAVTKIEKMLNDPTLRGTANT